MKPAAARRSCKRLAWRWREVARLPAVPGGATTATTRLLLADLDNNAALDVIVSAADTQVLLGGAPNGFASAAVAHRVAHLRGRRSGREGPTRSRRPRTRTAVSPWRRTPARSPYHWQRLRPRAATATGDQRINSFGIGGEVEVRSGLHVQTYPIASPVVHVGLGEATSSDVIRIFWPNGVLQSEFLQKADTTDPGRPAAEGLLPVAVCLERSRDGLRHRPDLAIAARPAHQRASDG